MEMKQFLECAQGQSDITLCQGFNEALKQCKMYYQATSKSSSELSSDIFLSHEILPSTTKTGINKGR